MKKYNLILFVYILSLWGCFQDKAGSKKIPLTVFISGGKNKERLAQGLKNFKDFLQGNSPYHFNFVISSKNTDIIDAFASKKAHAALVNTLSYLEIYEKYKGEAKLIAVRNGLDYYQGQFIYHVDSKFESLEDLNNKVIGFVDPISTSGYLIPLMMINDKQVVLKESKFFYGHDEVVRAVYEKKIDVGATYFKPSQNGLAQDARSLVRKEFPDVIQIVKVLGLTKKILNEPLVLSSEIDEETKKDIVNLWIKYQESAQGRKFFMEFFEIDKFRAVSDENYKKFRESLK